MSGGRIPKDKWPAKATPAEVLETGCPTCSAPPGAPCDGSYYRFFWLGMFVRDFSGTRIHTKRYLQRTAGAS